MNPFGAGHVVVTGDLVTDDGNFFTQNNQPVPLRWIKITGPAGTGFGVDPAPRRAKTSGRPAWFLTRDELARLRLSTLLAPGDYRIRVWGGVDADADWYEIGSGNSADNGATDVRIETTFTLGLTVDPLSVLLAGVKQLEGSNAYRQGFSNVLAGTRKCRQAYEALRP